MYKTLLFLTGILMILLCICLPLRAEASTAVINITATADTYVEEGYPLVSPWNNRNLYTGYDTYYGKKGTRTFLQIPVQQLRHKEILPSEIISATLRLYMYESEGTGNHNVDVYTPASFWDEYSLNWINQPTTQSKVSTTEFDNSTGWKEFDVTQYIVQILGNIPDRGLTLRMTNESAPAAIFWSIACTSPPTPPGCHNKEYPHIKVEYTPNNPPSKPILITPEDNLHTQETSILFQSQICTDPEGEKITYQLQIADKPDFGSLYYSSEFIDEPIFQYDIEPDRLYYWRIAAQDEHGPITGRSLSDTRTLTIDTTSPETPMIHLEPPFTTGSTNLVSWDPVTDNLSPSILYKVQVSKDEFKTTERQTEWTIDTELVIDKLLDGQRYCFRIIARDLAGNESPPSEFTCSTQDNGIPSIKNFTVTPQIISPTNKTSVNVHDNALITAEVTDTTLEEITINITDTRQQTIYKSKRLNGNIKEIWPPKETKDLKDGSYFVYIEAQDSFGNKNRSDSLTLIIDDTSPLAPQISLVPDNTKKLLDMTIYGETATTAQIYQDDKHHTNVLLESREMKFRILDGWEADRTYSYSVLLIDRAGNKSPTTKESFRTPPKKVLGIGSFKDHDKYPAQPTPGKCMIKYHKDRKTIASTDCKVPAPRISAITNHGTPDRTNHWYTIYGTAQPKIEMKVQLIRCKAKTIWDPRTWFSCVDEEYKQTKETINMNLLLTSEIKNSATNYKSRQELNTKYNFVYLGYTPKPISGKAGRTKITYSKSVFADGDWINIVITSNWSNEITVPKVDLPKSNKPFQFIFKKHIGVTQWHGYTAYQSPHTGIDFGSVEEEILSPQDGTIRAVGWDSYYGKCLSGGNFIRIEHKNGMHTVYMHLKNYKRRDGRDWKAGDIIKKGELVGITGNSGAWNCQALGYHLHFELRQNQYQSSHLNPVPYIDVDWNKIKTLGWETYPGRLSGDNPHPKF